MLDFLKQEKKESKKQCYFGLILKESSGIGIIIELDFETKSYTKVDQYEFDYSNSWEQLLEDVDAALYELEKRNNLTLKNVVFFLFSNLIDQKLHDIKKPYLKVIKSIVDELGLKASGFVEYHEAIAAYICSIEKTALSGIIIEQDASAISIYVYTTGDLVFSDSIGKTENEVEDVETVLARVKSDQILPTRIILAGTTHPRHHKKLFSEHHWEKELFIQIPRVEVLEGEQLIEALLHSFSAQLLNADKPVEKSTQIIDKSDVRVQKHIETRVHDSTKGNNAQQDEQNAPREGLMGFVIGGDVPDTESTNRMEKFLAVGREIANRFLVWFSDIPIPKGRIASVGLLIIGIVVISVSILYFFHTASVTLYLKPHSEKKELSITDDDLTFTKQEKTIELNETVVTTGSKIVGQKATGPILLYNSNTTEQSLKKGTKLTASGGITFVLDNDIKVASATSSINSEGNVLTVTGKVKSNVTASDLGPKGNIGKGEKLTIEGYSNTVIFALADAEFSGGSASEVQTVSRDDLNLLRDKIDQKLKTGSGGLIPESNKSIKVVAPLTSVNLSDESYTREVGEEANSVGLKAKGEVVFYTYEVDDLKRVIEDQFQKITPKNQELSVKKIGFTITKVSQTPSETKLTVVATGQFVRTIDEDEVINRLRGKTVNDVMGMKNELAVEKIDAFVQFPLPLLGSRIPFFSSKISVSSRPL